MTFTVPEELARQLVKRVPAWDLSRYVAAAIAAEFWWVRLDPTLGSEIAKTRLCLILSTNILNEHRKTVVVIPLSSSPQANPPLLIPVRCAGRDVVADR